MEKNSDNDKRGMSRRAMFGAMAGAGVMAAGAARAQQIAGNEEPDDTGSMDFSFEAVASQEALALLDGLNLEFPKDATLIAPDSIPGMTTRVSAAIDAFVAANPKREGKKINETTSEQPYLPFFDLRAALEIKVLDMNPTLVGLCWQKIKKEEGQVKFAENN